MSTKTQIAAVSKIIPAPTEEIYNIIADYRSLHPLILPKRYFLSLEVEEGGFGEGTIVRFRMRTFGRTHSFRSLITEPEPGYILEETDLNTNVSTSFTVLPLGHQNHTKVTIMTSLNDRGIVDGFLAKLVLQKIYAQELNLLAELAETIGEPMQPTSEKKQLSMSS